MLCSWQGNNRYITVSIRRNRKCRLFSLGMRTHERTHRSQCSGKVLFGRNDRPSAWFVTKGPFIATQLNSTQLDVELS